MGVFLHIVMFSKIVSSGLFTFSIFAVYSGLKTIYLYFLGVCLTAFAIVYRLRAPRPNCSTVRQILGNEWGAYLRSTSLDQSQEMDLCEKNGDNVNIKVIGHRACGLDAPENSLAALNRMFLNGIKMVEFDVTLTADSIPVVFHDKTLTRVADIPIRVKDMTLKEIKKVNISENHPFGDKYPRESIPTLYEFVCSCIAKNIKMIIDLKDNTPKMVNIINDLFKEFPELYQLAIVSSFNPFVIYHIRMKDPKIVGSLCWRPYFHSHEDYCGVRGPLRPRSRNPVTMTYRYLQNILHSWFLWNFGYYIVGASIVLLSKEAVSRDIIRYWRSKGIRLIAWSVNLPTEKQYFEKNLQITYMTDTAIIC